MHTYRKLPHPSLPQTNVFHFVYGLGYDSVGDDYKLLKIPYACIDGPEPELYSLRGNSWRRTQAFPGYLDRQRKGEFVSGALHWMVYPYDPWRKIISFDLSSEKYEEVAQPEYSPRLSQRPCYDDRVEVTILRGMLCVYVNYCRGNQFVVWVMVEYGVGKSWTKMFDINYHNAIPYFPPKRGSITLTPLYFYDDGQILIKAFTDSSNSEIFMYKDEKTRPRKIDARGSCSKNSNAFLYVESLISPATWPTVGYDK